MIAFKRVAFAEDRNLGHPGRTVSRRGSADLAARRRDFYRNLFQVITSGRSDFAFLESWIDSVRFENSSTVRLLTL
jgi:hypothetical protein